MKSALFLLITLGLTSALAGQTDSTQVEVPPIPIVAEEYSAYMYDSTLQMNILTYQYVDLYDIDHDGKNDSLIFIGNGGAHTFYYLQVRLSSQNHWVKFPQFQIDMPYHPQTEQVDFTDYFPQVAVADFDKDGVNEIYLNLNNSYGTISEELKQMGLTSNRILIEFEKGELIYKDFTEK